MGWVVCGALMACAAAFRVYLLHTAFAHIDGDQAVVGLMAYHVQAGDRPAFYYGQPYQGSLEAYLAAAVFNLWGAGDWTLRLPTLVFSVAFVGAVYWLAETLYGRLVAVLSGLFMALGPSLLINYSTGAGFGYVEAALCGTLLFVLAVRYPDLCTMPFAAALACGLLIGLGVWMQPLIGEYLVPLAVAYVVPLPAGWVAGLRRGRPPAAYAPHDGSTSDAPHDGSTSDAPHDGALLRRLGLLRALAAIVAGAAVGGAPFFVYNLRHHWATLTYLRGQAPSGDHLAVAERFVTQSLPVLLGLINPTTVASVFDRLVATHPLNYWAAVIGGTAILARLALDPRGGLLPRIAALGRRAPALDGAEHGLDRSPHAMGIGRDGVLALFALSCPLFYMFTSFGALHWGGRSPRYLIAIYTLTPLVCAVFVPRRAGRIARRIAVLVTAVLIGAGVMTTLATVPRPGIDGVTRILESRHVRVAYADYSLANRISFETHERVLGVPITYKLTLGQTRLPGYWAVAARTPADKLAWIFVAGDSIDQRFRLLLQRTHAGATRTLWRGWAVYHDLTQPLRAALHRRR